MKATRRFLRLLPIATFLGWALLQATVTLALEQEYSRSGKDQQSSQLIPSLQQTGGTPSSTATPAILNSTPRTSMEPRDWIAIGGLVAASAAFLSGLWQYRRAQQWKRAEFVASEMKAFEQDPLVAKALLMLDHNGRPIQLFTESEEKDADKRSPFVDDVDLTRALMHHRHRDDGFSEKELAIRDCFDRLLDKLSTFETYIRAKLISHKELECYLFYWVDIMANKNCDRKPMKFYDSLWDYIDGYNYNLVQRLFMRYGFNITPPAKQKRAK